MTVVVPSGEITLAKSPPKYRVVPMITCALTALEAPHVFRVGFAGGVACAGPGRANGSVTSVASTDNTTRARQRLDIWIVVHPRRSHERVRTGDAAHAPYGPTPVRKAVTQAMPDPAEPESSAPASSGCPFRGSGR